MADSDVRNRIKIQELLDNNIVRAGGDFHVDELDEGNFTYDLNNTFKLTPKEGEDSDELLKLVIKKSTKKVIGMINSRELKQGKFLKELFNKFEIERI